MENSTSQIVRRSALVVAFGLITHLFARLFWHLQMFGMNTVTVNCRYEETADDNGLGDWFYRVCDEIRGTDFVEYIPFSDTSLILVTHIAGLAVTLAIFRVIAWIISKEEATANYVVCSERDCQCHSHHHPQQYIEGAWEYADCTNPNCPCIEHKGDAFDAKQGKWV